MHHTPSILQLFISFIFFFMILFHIAVHMTRLEENDKLLQIAGYQLMIKMVQRGNRRINVKQKSHKMKKHLTQIQINKLVSIKLSFSMSIQWEFPFCCKISALTQIFRDFNLLGNIRNHIYIITLSTGRSVKNITGYNKKKLLED